MKPIMKGKWRMHYQYDIWKYVVLIILAVLLVGLLYDMTKPATPPDKLIKVMGVGAIYSEEMDQLANKAVDEALPDQVIEIGVTSMAVGDDLSTSTKVAVMIAARDGDVYIMRKDIYQEFVGQQAFIPLEGLIADGTIKADSEQPEWTYGTGVEHGETHLYGITLADLPGLLYTMHHPEEYVISVTEFSRNQENAIAFVDWVLEAMQAEWKPAGVE